ncbi:SNAA protein, partial [Polyodon spathula]|nr:SNAA protein [Polyodon spathula]
MDNSGKEKEALALIAEAEKKTKSSQSFFANMFGKTFLMGMLLTFLAVLLNFLFVLLLSAAGNAFAQAAQLHLQQQSKHDAATSFIDAGNAFKKADPQEAINCLNRAIEIYTDMGRFTIAAKHHVSIAEIYESELVDIDKASVCQDLLHCAEESADITVTECNGNLSRQCYCSCSVYIFVYVVYIFVVLPQVGTHAMDSTLLKYSAKEYFFKAALCHFCVDMLNAKVRRIDENETPIAQRCVPLPGKLLDAHEEQNVDAYTESVKEYDTISRLDQWLTTMLLRIKKTIQGEESDLR